MNLVIYIFIFLFGGHLFSQKESSNTYIMSCKEQMSVIISEMDNLSLPFNLSSYDSLREHYFPFYSCFEKKTNEYAFYDNFCPRHLFTCMKSNTSSSRILIIGKHIPYKQCNRTNSYFVFLLDTNTIETSDIIEVAGFDNDFYNMNSQISMDTIVTTVNRFQKFEKKQLYSSNGIYSGIQDIRVYHIDYENVRINLVDRYQRFAQYKYEKQTGWSISSIQEEKIRDRWR